MKWTIHVVVNAARPQDGQHFNLIAIDADSEQDAARFAAEASAKRLFGEHGAASFVNAVIGQTPMYKANVGVYEGGGVTKGTSLTMLVMEYSK